MHPLFKTNFSMFYITAVREAASKNIKVPCCQSRRNRISATLKGQIRIFVSYILTTRRQTSCSLSSVSHFLSTGSYPIWASSFIPHLFIWHLNNSSIQEYKSELWYAVSYPVISSAHMVKCCRNAREKIILDVSVTLTLSSKVQLCKNHHRQRQILPDFSHLIFKCFLSQWILCLGLESLSIYQGNCYFFLTKSIRISLGYTANAASTSLLFITLLQL